MTDNTEKINEIKKKVKISSFFDKDVLEITPDGFKTTCPFHKEDTPSFFIKDEDGVELFYCFGCSTGGDIFNFLALKENKSFSDVLSEYDETTIAESAIAPKKRKSTFNFYHKLIDKCSTYFQTQLLANKSVLNHLNDRSITEDDVKFFKLGYSEESIVTFLDDNNLNKDYAEEVGLIRKKNSIYYDVIKNRITIPIFNKNEIITGISSRAYLPTDTYGKYINPPNNKIFKKNATLYGINWSTSKIKEKDYVIIVEGYFDFITLYKNGFENTVAVLGTNLFSEQVKILSSLTNNFYFCFDKDLAGKQAIVKSIKECIKAGVNINVIEFPESKEKLDPDEFVKKNGPEAFKILIKNVTPLVNFIEKCGEDSIQILEDLSFVIPKIESTVKQQFWYKNILDVIGVDIRKDIKKEFFNKNREKPLSIEDTVFLKTFINTDEKGKELLLANNFLKSSEAIFLLNKLKNDTYSIIFTETEENFLNTIRQKKQYSLEEIQKIIKQQNEEKKLK